MDFSKKSPNKVSYITIFTSVFFGIFLLTYLLVGLPVLKYSDDMKSEFSRKQAKLLESQELVRTLPNPQKAMDEVKAQLLELQEIGVSKKQVPRMMQILGATAADKNLTVVSLRPREDIKSENSEISAVVNRIYLEIVLLCSYQMLADYIKTVSGLPPAFKVESLTIEKQSETLAPMEAKSAAKNQPAGLLKAVIVLSTFAG